MCLASSTSAMTPPHMVKSFVRSAYPAESTRLFTLISRWRIWMLPSPGAFREEVRCIVSHNGLLWLVLPPGSRTSRGGEAPQTWSSPHACRSSHRTTRCYREAEYLIIPMSLAYLYSLPRYSIMSKVPYLPTFTLKRPSTLSMIVLSSSTLLTRMLPQTQASLPAPRRRRRS